MLGLDVDGEGLEDGAGLVDRALAQLALEGGQGGVRNGVDDVDGVGLEVGVGGVVVLVEGEGDALVIPLRPLSIGEILGGAFESLRANPKAMFIPSLVVMGITGLLSAGSVALFMSRLGLTDLTSGKVEFSETDLDSIGSSLVSLLIQLGVTGVLSMLATSIIEDRKSVVRERV